MILDFYYAIIIKNIYIEEEVIMKKERILYFSVFIFLVAIEVLIALFVHDGFVRPYLGDVIIVILLYCFVRIFIPKKLKLLPLYIFIFSVAIEILQYFNYVTLLGLEGSKFFKTLLGTGFSFIDILCYFIGCVICFYIQYITIFKRKK